MSQDTDDLELTPCPTCQASGYYQKPKKTSREVHELEQRLAAAEADLKTVQQDLKTEQRDLQRARASLDSTWVDLRPWALFFLILGFVVAAIIVAAVYLPNEEPLLQKPCDNLSGFEKCACIEATTGEFDQKEILACWRTLAAEKRY